MTTATGCPVANNSNSRTAGVDGPILLEDHHLLEKLARFNRERIPERVVHAHGSGAHGVFTVTNDVSAWTKARFLSKPGQSTPTFVRFSTVALERGSADTVREPRGFAVKFYTQDGNYDLVGNNTPIFFLRDPLKFPDFIHSQKRDPHTNLQSADAVWDFFSLQPELTHQFIWMFGDRGIPASYRRMDGFGSHTFRWTNQSGEAFWVKLHLKTNQGIACLSDDEAVELAGANPNFHQADLYDSISRGEFPSWTLKVQVMPVAAAKDYRFNPFDLTKVWPHNDYPLQEVGRLTLNRNPSNYFAEVEQAAFNPANFVPGIGPSPDRMLQGRLFAYGDAQRYRLGVNHTYLPINAAQCPVHTYGRDGLMCPGDNGGSSTNYEPNSDGGPVPTGQPTSYALPVQGATVHEPASLHSEDDDYTQAGMLFRIMSTAEQQRLIRRIATSLSAVRRIDTITRSIEHFHKADTNLGTAMKQAVEAAKNN